MGDLHVWPLQGNGTVGDPQRLQSHPPNPEPSAIKSDVWKQAEEATEEVIHRIQPTVVSEQRRRAVVYYVQKLIHGYNGTEVFPFGSVPLKTYLPDGDIDLTAFGIPYSEDALANDVRSVLELEEQNKDAEFEVKDVQYIQAEVKLVKCLVQNIVVDISFNQIGGLCTLCFLEQVDLLIGKDHLFKRSIMLIKAWCYYESRILGAHHGLISTYALETLILYIFHLFHKSLDGPLAVLYRFLDYYSKFDWDGYGVSLLGPVALLSMPELAVEPPETRESDLLLSEEFLRQCVEMFSVRPMGYENYSRIFNRKHLNIVDPLKQSNNLGRSVSKGNFYRIRSAFLYGARKLAQMLLLPAEGIADEIKGFFKNTLERHGIGERPDVHDALPCCRDSPVTGLTTKGSMASCSKDGKSEKDGSSGSHRELCEQFNNIGFASSEKIFEPARLTEGDPISEHMEGVAASRKTLASDARDLVTSQSFHLATGDENSAVSSSAETGTSLPGKACYSPHDYGSNYDAKYYNHPSNSSIKTMVSLSRVEHPIAEVNYESESSGHLTSWFRYGAISSSTSSTDGSASSWNTCLSQESQLADLSITRKEADGNERPKINQLSELTGDYDVHFYNLQRAQGFMMGSAILPFQLPINGQYQNKHSWNAFNRQNLYSYTGSNGVITGPPVPPAYYWLNHPVVPGLYGTEDSPKPRGTGTYFPNPNFRSYRERWSPGKGKGPFLANQQMKSRSNGRADVSTDKISLEEAGHELPSHRHIPTGNGGYTPNTAEMSQSSRAATRGLHHGNGHAYPQDNKLEFGSFGPVPLAISLPERTTKLDSSNQTSPGTVQRPGTGFNHKRTKPYKLKDEGDFPPLSG